MLYFWDYHTGFFLIFAVFFPRLTLLFATSVPFGVLAWIGWFFVPRFVIAYYATVFYSDKHPILVAIAWVVAIMALLGAGGETARRTR
ncbi:MAG TPA: hypothetical protein VHD55_03210 [Candidatus Paceibacterota bacterium]|nr:hypothetical protein [Candidatus Paceibacterota bacterium]